MAGGVSVWRCTFTFDGCLRGAILSRKWNWNGIALRKDLWGILPGNIEQKNKDKNYKTFLRKTLIRCSKVYIQTWIFI